MDIENLGSLDKESENSNEDSIDNFENYTREWKISYKEDKNFWNKARVINGHIIQGYAHFAIQEILK